MTEPELTDEEIEGYRQVILQRIKLGSSMEVSHELLRDVCENSSLKIQRDFFSGRLVMTMYSFIAAMPETRIKAQWPVDWWHAVRLRFAPRWCLRRWPIRYCELDEPQFENVYLSLFADRASKYPDGVRMVVEHGEIKCDGG